jgi:hypothetical protein
MIKRHRPFTEIEEVARRLRVKLDIDHLECPDLISIFENGLTEVYPGLRLIRALDEDLPDSEAQTDCYERTITGERVFFRAASRESLAHE